MNQVDYDYLTVNIQRIFQKSLKFIIGFIILTVLLVSCDADYYITKYTASKYTTDIFSAGVTKTPFQAKKNLKKNGFVLKPIARVEIAGNFLTAQKDYLRTNCPFKRKLVDGINETFPYIYVMEINKVQGAYLFISGKRIIRQTLEDIASTFSNRVKFFTPVSVEGYELNVPEIKETFKNITPVYVEKITVYNRVYE